ncbi:hypothetical protein BaRGS_00027645 [Batillaria attramentaria]|uniref:Uncharacterized protein n=1 Tax=Batillaria attramentaria TaxID=370345 RepID=A0ABD0K2M8_9CAEN
MVRGRVGCHDLCVDMDTQGQERSHSLQSEKTGKVFSSAREARESRYCCLLQVSACVGKVSWGHFSTQFLLFLPLPSLLPLSLLPAPAPSPLRSPIILLVQCSSLTLSTIASQRPPTTPSLSLTPSPPPTHPTSLSDIPYSS